MTDYSQLFNEVMQNSTAKNWDKAVGEWVILDCIEDPYCSSQCICGKENIKYLFTIENFTNGKRLFPIGSSCIRKFEKENLMEDANVLQAEFDLLHAVQDNKFITLKGGLFSRKLLAQLHKEGAFNTSYNNYNGDEDYDFMLRMFNKRNDCTLRQSKKINAIILKSIIPHLDSKLESKILANKTEQDPTTATPKDREQE